MKTNRKVTKKIIEAIKVLKDGGVIVFPTETCYGIGCDAQNTEAVELIKAIKLRPEGMPMSLIVKDMEMAEKYGKFSDTARTLAEKHWPGPLMVILPIGQNNLSQSLTNNGKLGMRVSSSKIVKKIMAEVDFPIVATSANVHGKSSTYCIEDTISQFSDAGIEPDLYLDGGELEVLAPSMIIEIVAGEVVVHRAGSFKLNI